MVFIFCLQFFGSLLTRWGSQSANTKLLQSPRNQVPGSEVVRGVENADVPSVCPSHYSEKTWWMDFLMPAEASFRLLGSVPSVVLVKALNSRTLSPKDLGDCSFITEHNSYLMCTCPGRACGLEAEGLRWTQSCHSPSSVHWARIDCSGYKPGHLTPWLKKIQWFPIPIWIDTSSSCSLIWS